jgi:hypothetical protein
MASRKQIPKGPPLERHKSLVHDLSDTGRESNQANVNFLKIDVETALTFTRLALRSDSAEKRKRNLQHARKAYNTIQRLSHHVTFTADEEAYMRDMMAILKNNLETLGEKFS